MRALVSVAVLLLTIPAASKTAAPAITAIEPIRLSPGVNSVPGFLPGDRTARIVEAWRGNGNAHGYSAWMVLTGPSEGEPVGLAPFADDDGARYRDTIRDDPFDGERVMGSVVFARARVDGRPASITIDAELDHTPDRPFADHEPATIRVYRLTENDGVGPPLAFELIAKLHSAKRYCNVELALRDMLGVPLPKDYAGPNAVDGCIRERS